MHIIKLIIRALIIIALGAAAIFLTITPDLLPMGFHTDKMLHIFGFSILSIFVYFKYKMRQQFIIAIATLCCIGISIEAIQIFVPNRTAQLEDLSANLIGIIYGTITGYFLKKGIRRSLEKV